MPRRAQVRAAASGSARRRTSRSCRSRGRLGRPMHLLVIEDDPKLGRLLSRMLGDDHHLVELAVTGREGLELSELGGLDAVILDVGLPDMEGYAVAASIRARGDGVPILMLTARDAIDDRVRGLDSGADDYLVKPFAFEELRARLRALGRRSSGAP